MFDTVRSIRSSLEPRAPGAADWDFRFLFL